MNRPDPVQLTWIKRGDTSPVYTVTVARKDDAPDLTLPGTVIRVLVKKKGTSSVIARKAIGAGVTVTDATHFSFRLESEDTSRLSIPDGDPLVLELEAEVTESDGDVTTPWAAELPIWPDIG